MFLLSFREITIKKSATVFCFLILTGSLLAQISCSYKYRKRITINPAYVSGPLDFNDFPVIISITGDNDLKTSTGHVLNTNGYDIIFTASDGVTQLNHQLTNYNGANGDLDCWVKVPTLSTSINTYIYIYYGNAAATTDQSSTSTWSNGFVGVWHFDNDVNNSTATTWLNGTNNGSTNNTTSKIGSARRFQSASSQYVDVTPYNAAYNLFSNITVSGWIRPSTIGVDQKIAGNEDNVGGGWKFGVYTDNKLEFEIRNSANSPFLSRSASGGTALANNTWYYVTGQYSDPGDFINTYLNGTLDRNYSTTANCWSSNGTMKIGCEPFSSSAFFDGRMDELRISNVIRSADWIATEYNNQNTPGPGTFYTISVEPKVWLGTTNTNWNTAGNWSGGTVPAASNDIIISNTTPANQPVLNASPQVGGLWLYTGTTLGLSNQTISVAYDIMNCGTINGSTGMVTLNSAAANIQTQNLSGSGTYNLNSLTVNNTFASPSVLLNKDINISGALVLTSGIVYTSTTNILALGTSATSTSGSATSFISGPISKIGLTDFVFPVGKGTLWRRAAVSNLSASSTFRAEYFNTAYTNTSSVNAPLYNVSKIEYWQIDRIVGAGNANVSLYWENASSSGINNCPDLTITRWNGASWDERPGTSVGASNCSAAGTGTITSTALITAFSPFTFASKLSGVNPLPVGFIDLTGSCDEEGVKLNWSTATEKENLYFVVERSTNGFDWTAIRQVAGSGTSTSIKKYSILDNYFGKDITYYRLKQKDINGDEKVLKLIVMNCLKKYENEFSLYPNPANKEINIEVRMANPSGSCLIKIIDNIGRLLYEYSINITEYKTNLKMPVQLTSGAYTILISTGEIIFPPKKLIIQSSGD